MSGVSFHIRSDLDLDDVSIVLRNQESGICRQKHGGPFSVFFRCLRLLIPRAYRRSSFALMAIQPRPLSPATVYSPLSLGDEIGAIAPLKRRGAAQRVVDGCKIHHIGGNWLAGFAVNNPTLDLDPFGKQEIDICTTSSYSFCLPSSRQIGLPS